MADTYETVHKELFGRKPARQEEEPDLKTMVREIHERITKTESDRSAPQAVVVDEAATEVETSSPDETPVDTAISADPDVEPENPAYDEDRAAEVMREHYHVPEKGQSEAEFVDEELGKDPGFSIQDWALTAPLLITGNAGMTLDTIQGWSVEPQIQEWTRALKRKDPLETPQPDQVTPQAQEPQLENPADALKERIAKQDNPRPAEIQELFKTKKVHLPTEKELSDGEEGEKHFIETELDDMDLGTWARMAPWIIIDNPEVLDVERLSGWSVQDQIRKGLDAARKHEEEVGNQT